MSAEHKRLLRLAAEYLTTMEWENQFGIGMCCAVYRMCDNYQMYAQCARYLYALYSPDAPRCIPDYWMGPEFTEEQQRHRVMALLFAAEAYDDMGGV